MILTLTPNTTIDLIVFIPKLIPNTTIRATQTYYSMGGKPTDASWILGRMGVSSHALGLAAGSIGNKVKSLLAEFDVTSDVVESDGETRINTVLVDENSGEQTTITTTSMTVTDEHLAELRDKYVSSLEHASVVITGGSLPKGMSPKFYVDAINLAHEHHVPVIFDASQPNLEVGLHAKPTYIKPNEHELSALMGYKIDSIESAYRAGQDILQKYGTQPIITLGENGALAILCDKTYRIPPLELDIKSAAGAGDSVLAGLAHAIHHNTPIEEGLRLGIATASAVCLHPATAAYHLPDMQRLLPQVELLPYP